MLHTTTIQCPYCGEPVELAIDASAGPQVYIEDCQVCCQPMTVVLEVEADGLGRVHVHGQDEA